MPGTLIFRKVIIKRVLLRITSFIFIALMLSVGGCATVQAEEIKDTIDQLSFSHDGKKILFERCREGVCQIQVYDLETRELSAYQSPPNEQWTMARYSYDGKKIVLSSIPMGEEYLNLSDMQIVVMDPEGKNMKKITTGYGAKIYPTFSHSGMKVLYAKAGYIRKKGGTPAAQFDAWEVDLEIGKEKRLTYFKFFTMSHLNYFPNDEQFICNASGPELFPGVREGDWNEIDKRHKEWAHKYKSNTIFTLREGQIIRDAPYIIVNTEHFIGDKKIIISQSEKPLLSKDGLRLLFEGYGQRYYLYSPDGNHRLVGGGGSVNSAAISPDGKLLGIIDAEISITIFHVQDGSQLEKLYLPRMRSNPHFKGILHKIKLVPEQPSKIINR